ELILAHGKVRAFWGWEQERTLAYFPGEALFVIDHVVAQRRATVVSRARLVPGRIPLVFVPLSGTPSSGRGWYSPRFGEAQEIEEHCVSAHGADVWLGFALRWGARRPRAQLSLDKRRIFLDERAYDLT